MLTIIFTILLVAVFIKLLLWAIKAAWGIVKVIFTVVLIPLAVVALAVFGLMYVAIPILIIVGIIALIGSGSG